MAAAIAGLAGNVVGSVGGNLPTMNQATKLFDKQIAQDKRLFSAQCALSSPLAPPHPTRQLLPTFTAWQVRGGGRAAQ